MQIPIESIVLANVGIIVNSITATLSQPPVRLTRLCMFLMYSHSYLLLGHCLHYRSINYRSCRLHYLPLNASPLYYHSLLLFVGCRSIRHLSSGNCNIALSPVQIPIESIVLANVGLSLTPLPLRYHSLPVRLTCLCMFLMYSHSYLPLRRYLHYRSINYRSCRLHYLPLNASLLYYHSLLLFVVS